MDAVLGLVREENQEASLKMTHSHNTYSNLFLDKWVEPNSFDHMVFVTVDRDIEKMKMPTKHHPAHTYCTSSAAGIAQGLCLSVH